MNVTVNDATIDVAVTGGINASVEGGNVTVTANDDAIAVTINDSNITVNVTTEEIAVTVDHSDIDVTVSETAIGGGASNHAQLDNLDYEHAGHTGFEAEGAANSALVGHVAAADPHTQYLLESTLPTRLFNGAFTDVVVPGAEEDLKYGRWNNAAQRMEWASVSVSPGGSNTHVQYNSAGIFAGNSGFIYDGSGTITVSSSVVVGSTGAKIQSDGTLKGYTLATPLIQYGDGSTNNANPRITPKTPTGSGIDLWIEGMDRLHVKPNFSTFWDTPRWDWPTGSTVLWSGMNTITIQPGFINLKTTSANTIVFAGGAGLDTTIQGYDSTHPINLQIAGSSATNAIVVAARLRHNSSGTPAAGYGSAIAVQGKSSTTSDRDMGRLIWQWVTATDASRASKGQLSAYYTTTERPVITWGADSSVPLLSFYDVTTPIARQVLATGAGRTVDDVITALQNLGLVKQS